MSQEKCLTPFCRNQWDGSGVWIKGKWLCGRCWDKTAKTLVVEERK